MSNYSLTEGGSVCVWGGGGHDPYGSRCRMLQYIPGTVLLVLFAAEMKHESLPIRYRLSLVFLLSEVCSAVV